MNLKTLGGAAAALIVLPGICLAEFNYTNVDFGYVDVEYDLGPASLDGDGFAISGQFAVADNFYIGGTYEDYGFDFDVDGEFMEVGGGYFHPMNDTLDFVATLSYVDAELSSGGFSADDDGLGIGGGVRFAVSDSFHLDAMLDHVDFDNGGSDTGVEMRARYYFNSDLAIGGQMDLGKDIETMRIGLRYEF